MNQNIKRLFDIEIDEVSVVDRPANQHGLIAFAKNDSSDELEAEVPGELFDETGENIPVEVLEHGDIVFDAEGNEFVYVEDDEDDDDVEKGMFSEGLKGFRAGARKYLNTSEIGASADKMRSKAMRRGNSVMDYAKKNPGKTAMF